MEDFWSSVLSKMLEGEMMPFFLRAPIQVHVTGGINALGASTETGCVNILFGVRQRQDAGLNPATIEYGLRKYAESARSCTLTCWKKEIKESFRGSSPRKTLRRHRSSKDILDEVGKKSIMGSVNCQLSYFIDKLAFFSRVSWLH